MLKKKKGEIEVKKKLISGILATIFLVTMVTVALPAQVSAEFTADPVKIGIVGPKGWIQWDGLWEAAQLARDMINKEAEFAGEPGQKGILTVDGLAKLELVDIDEHSVPAPDPAAAIAELLTKLDANPDMYSIFGGFRTECVAPMEEALLDYAAVKKRPIWTIAGAATDSLIAPVATNYARYKYMFRATPLNSTVMAVTFGQMIKQIAAPKLAALYQGDPTKLVPTFIIAENLVWCDSMVAFIQGYAAGLGMDLKGVRRPSPVATDFASDIAAAQAAQARIVIHIFSAVAGANFIKQVGALKPKFACIGINVESQQQEFYESVGGACEYEAFLASTGTQEGRPKEESQNPDSKPLTSTEFWTIYKGRYGHAPIYTAWGAYDAVIALNETSYDPIGSGKPSAGKGWSVYRNTGEIDKWIEHTETLGLSDGFAWTRVEVGGAYYRSGILGYFRYTGPDGTYHDPFCTSYSFSPLHDGVVRAFIPQWQAGSMEVTFPRDRPFSRKWIVPPWMYSLETDFAGGPLVPTGVGTLKYTTPNGAVEVADLDAIGEVWFKKLSGLTGFHRLECDMQPYDHLINVYDAAKVGRDWGETATPQ